MADSLFYHSILSCSECLHSVVGGQEEHGQLNCSTVDLYLCGEGFGLCYANVKLKTITGMNLLHVVLGGTKFRIKPIITFIL